MNNSTKPDIDSCQHKLAYLSTDRDVEIGEDQKYRCEKNCGYEVIANIVNGEINVLVDYDVNYPILASSRPMNDEGKGIEPHIYDQIMDSQKERDKEDYLWTPKNYLYSELFDSKNEDHAISIINEIVKLDERKQREILLAHFTDIQYIKSSIHVMIGLLKELGKIDEAKRRIDFNFDEEKRKLK